MDVQFSLVATEEVDTLLVMAKAFHAEDGHPLSPAGEAALSQMACFVARNKSGGMPVAQDGETVTGRKVHSQAIPAYAFV